MNALEQEWIFNFVSHIVAACIIGGAIHSGLVKIADALRSSHDRK